MRMEHSIADFEEKLRQEMAVERTLHEGAVRRAQKHERSRMLARLHRRGSMRYALLVLAIIATAVVVTIAMFETLYYVMA